MHVVLRGEKTAHHGKHCTLGSMWVCDCTGEEEEEDDDEEEEDEAEERDRSQGELIEMRQRLMALSKHGAKRRESQSSTLGILAAGTLHHCG